MKLFILLTIGCQLFAQIGLQPPDPVVPDSSLRGYFAYNVRIGWDGQEVVGDNEVLNVTYDMVKLYLFIYTDIQPDSVVIHHMYGDGVFEYGKIQLNKGMYLGKKEAEITTLEKVAYGLCGAIIVGGIYISYDAIRN